MQLNKSMKISAENKTMHDRSCQGGSSNIKLVATPHSTLCNLRVLAGIIHSKEILTQLLQQQPRSSTAAGSARLRSDRLNMTCWKVGGRCATCADFAQCVC